MSDVSTRTIVINSDDSWPFRDLACCHALDLYPLDSGVDLFDVVAPSVAEIGRDSRNYQSVIGNFPEDYSGEPDTLLEEIDEIIAGMASANRSRDYLALTLVLKKDDFQALATARDLASVVLSASGQVGFQALLGAMKAVEAQGDQDDENVVGRMSTRVWFSLVVRDAGANSADLRASEKVYTLTQLRQIGVQNLFFLSEGRGQDTLDHASTKHFAKLRMLIDILRQTHTDTVQKSLRARSARDFGIDPSLFLWLRTAENEQSILANSDLIRRDLVSRFVRFTDTENREKGEGWQTELSSIKDRLNGVLPGLANDGLRSGDVNTDAYTEHRALNAVMTAAKNAQASNSEEVFDGLDAELEIADIIKKLGKRRRGWLFSKSAATKIQTRSGEYEAALTQSRAVFDASVAVEIDALRADLENKRTDLHATLQEITLPTTQDALQDLAEYSRDVLQVQATAAALEISDTRAKNEQADALSEKVWQDMRGERQSAVDHVLETENRLLRLKSALTVIFMVSCIALLPILVVPFALMFNSALGSLTIGEIFGPMGIIVLFNVGVALIFAMMLARRLARNRNIALEKLRDLMGNHYEALRLSFAGLMRISVNRGRLSLLNTAMGFLQPNKGMTTPEPAEQFIAKLSTMQAHLDQPNAPMSEKTLQALEAAFQRGTKPAERITSVLIADLPKPEDPPEMTVLPGYFGATEFKLRLTSAPGPLSLRLGAVGDE